MFIINIGPLILMCVLYSAVLAADGWKPFCFVYGVAIVVIVLLVRNRRRKDARRRQEDREAMAEAMVAARQRADGQHVRPAKRSWFVG